VRASIPSTASNPPREAILESLERAAARLGGDTITVLPGMHSISRTVRASIFLCDHTTSRSKSIKYRRQIGAATRRACH